MLKLGVVLSFKSGPGSSGVVGAQLSLCFRHRSFKEPTSNSWFRTHFQWLQSHKSQGQSGPAEKCQDTSASAGENGARRPKRAATCSFFRLSKKASITNVASYCGNRYYKRNRSAQETVMISNSYYIIILNIIIKNVHYHVLKLEIAVPCQDGSHHGGGRARSPGGAPMISR